MKKYVYLALGFSMFALAACEHAHYEPKLKSALSDTKSTKSDKDLQASKDDLSGIKSSDAQTAGKAAYREKCEPSFQFAANAEAGEVAISLKDIKGSLDLLKMTYYSADQTQGTQIEGTWTQEGRQIEVSCHNTVDSNSSKTGILASIPVPYHIDPSKDQMTTTVFALQGKQGSVAADRKDSKNSESSKGFGNVQAKKAGGAESILVARQDGTIAWRFQGTRKNAQGDLIYEIVEAVYGSTEKSEIVDPKVLNQDSATTPTSQSDSNSED